MKLVWAVELWAAEMSALDSCHSHLLNNIDFVVDLVVFWGHNIIINGCYGAGDTC